MKFDITKIEEKILKFWEREKIFEKLREKIKGNSTSRAKFAPGQGKRWSFLDGPITANNPMGVHHAWGRTYKDIFQRHKALKGFDERFQNGFDCQGLWVEVEVEKELGFKNKKDIEEYGIDKFVEKCKERVRKYSKIQTEQSIRLGQWMDWENSYFTMSDENNYAIWHFLKKCYEKGLLYKGRDSVPWCPRCATAISQHEILTEEYKKITHTAVYLKLPIVEKPPFAKAAEGAQENIYFLVWTTTPWTIPANVALAVNPNFEYGLFKTKEEQLILLKDLADKILPEGFKLEKTFSGKELLGLKYEAPFDDLERVKEAREENPETFHTVVGAEDSVNAEEGTGIVHTAPGAGAEDFKLAQEKKLSVIAAIDETAVYLDGMGEFSGKNAKENPEIIFDYLKEKEGGRFFYKTEDYIHRYPTCWRCKTELVWRVVDEWYIAMDKLREPLKEAAKKIKWIPEFGLERELDWLNNMRDWLISKKRYWGLALPIFECPCGNFEVIGSKEELKERAVEGWEEFEGHSPHRPWVDRVKIKCPKCGRKISRVPDVGNPWLDAGIVPFSTMRYFTDKEYWKKWFPADLVCESFPGQFKNWFYSIITMSMVLEGAPPVKTIFGYASVKDEKGEEMHKSKGNTIWFDEAIEKIGAEPMRWMYARQNPAYDLRFGFKAADEVKRKLLNLYNSLAFFNTYVEKNELRREDLMPDSENILDRWIISRLNNLIKKVNESLDKYDAAEATISIENFFINDLSLWYIRRSRTRFRRAGKEREEARDTLYYVLLNLAKIIAPILPFFAEEMYQSLHSDSKLKAQNPKPNIPVSVHLCDFPEADTKLIDRKLEEKMSQAREIVGQVLALRAEAKIKVRQPLKTLKIKKEDLKEEKSLLELIKKEVNVKEVIFDKNIEKEIDLDFKITEELKKEGVKRELLRNIKEMRKRLGLVAGDVIEGIISTYPAIEDNDLINEAGARTGKVVEDISKEETDIKKEITLDGKTYHLGIKK